MVDSYNENKLCESTSCREICREQVTPGWDSSPEWLGMVPHGCCGMRGRAVCELWAGRAEELELMLCWAAGLCRQAEAELGEETRSNWHVKAGRLETARG